MSLKAWTYKKKWYKFVYFFWFPPGELNKMPFVMVQTISHLSGIYQKKTQFPKGNSKGINKVHMPEPLTKMQP